MIKRLNKILHDKNDYHHDKNLKNDVELSDFLLQSTIKLQRDLILRKIKYFYKYDKYFFLRVLLKNFLKLMAILFVVFVLSILMIYVLNIDIDFKKIEKEKIKNIPVYIPSTGNIEKDSLRILYYKENLNKDANYIIFYLKDPSKNFDKWAYALGQIESGNFENQYIAKRENSQYWGKYQMGEDARRAIKMDKYTWDEFKSNPELQEVGLKLWVEVLYKELKYEIKKYNSTFLNGWYITESGIISMAHNVGPEPTKQFLNSGGKIIPKDGSGKDATRFLILGNYDLEIN